MLKYETNIMRIGSSRYILIPHNIINDSGFPFKDKDKLTIKIVGNTFQVRKKGTFRKKILTKKK